MIPLHSIMHSILHQISAVSLMWKKILMIYVSLIKKISWTKIQSFHSHLSAEGAVHWSANYLGTAIVSNQDPAAWRDGKITAETKLLTQLFHSSSKIQCDWFDY